MKTTTSCRLTAMNLFLVLLGLNLSLMNVQAVDMASAGPWYIEVPAGREAPYEDLDHAWNVNEMGGSGNQHVWAVGRSGLIRATHNGGRTWRTENYVRAVERRFGVNELSFNSLSVVSPSVAWVAGNYGNVWRTTNGGTAWVQVYGAVFDVNAPDFHPINWQSISALDANTAWAIQNESQPPYGFPSTTRLMKSLDGGANWTIVLEGAQAAGAKIVRFVTASTGYLLRQDYNGSLPINAVLLRTVDGGTTWTQVLATTVDGTNSALAYKPLLKVVNANTVFVGVDFEASVIGNPVTGAPRLFRTLDGGSTWASTPIPNVHPSAQRLSIASMDFVDANTGFAVGNVPEWAADERRYHMGDEAVMLRTTNGGASWTFEALTASPQLPSTPQRPWGDITISPAPLVPSVLEYMYGNRYGYPQFVYAGDGNAAWAVGKNSYSANYGGSAGTTLYLAGTVFRRGGPVLGNLRPVAEAGADVNVSSRVTATLDGRASTDTENNIVAYAWTGCGVNVVVRGPGAVFNDVPLQTSTNYPVSNVFILTVFDEAGNFDSDVQVVTVLHGSSAGLIPDPNLPPVANAGPDQLVADSDGDGGEMIALDGSASYDPDRNNVVFYEWWENGQRLRGSIENINGNPMHIRLPVGIHDIAMKIYDVDGGSAWDMLRVEVKDSRNVAPTAVLEVGRNPAVVGEPVPFFGSASSDPEGGPLTYAWDFGDGSISNQPNPVHTFGDFSNYLLNTTASLRVTDTDGLSSTFATATFKLFKKQLVQPPFVWPNGNGDMTGMTDGWPAAYTGREEILTWGVYFRRNYYDVSQFPQFNLEAGDDFLHFTLAKAGSVYIAHDDRISPRPAWLADWQDTGEDVLFVETLDGSRNVHGNLKMSIFKKDFPAGEIVLGGNGGFENELRPTPNIKLWDGSFLGNVNQTSRLYKVAFGDINHPPEAVIDASLPAMAGTPVTFSGANSYDPDGTVVGYKWEFYSMGWLPQDYGMNVIRSFQAGRHQAYLTVTDNRGYSGSVGFSNYPGYFNIYGYGTLGVNARLYVDQDVFGDYLRDKVTTVPAAYSGLSFIRTGELESGTSGSLNSLFTFTLNEASTVYVAHMDNIASKPAWLSSWTDTGDNIGVRVYVARYAGSDAYDRTYSLFQKHFAAGPVTLGENGGTGDQNGRMYFVVVRPDSGVLNGAPVARISANPNPAFAGTPVAFSSNGSSDPNGDALIAHSWTFGDGATSSAANLSHAYALPGTYSVELAVMDARGKIGRAQTSIVVTQNMPPIARITATPDSGVPPLAVTLDGSSSLDSDGSIASYAWDYGDGSTSTVASGSHTFNGAGQYNVTLVVTDNRGATGSQTISVFVRNPNQPPVVTAGATPSSGNAPLAVAFSGSATDPEGQQLFYHWNFGDGTSEESAATNHSYTESGIYTAIFTVTDSGGASASAFITIDTRGSGNQPPVIGSGPTAVPNPVLIGEAISFLAVASDPDGAVASYAWNFGDGSTGTGASTSHVYANAGTYTVTLTVSDNNVPAATAVGTVFVTVNAPPPPPPPGNKEPVITVAAAASPNPALIGQTVAFSVEARDPDGDALGFIWHFGDGSRASANHGAHAYGAAGTYMASVIISDSKGGTVTGSVEVVVSAGTGDGGGGKPPRPMTITKLQGSMKFNASGKDACSLTGVIPNVPALFNPAGVSVALDIGGATVSFTLDAKGRAKSSNGVLTLKLKPGKRNKTTKKLEFLGGNVPFQAKLGRGSWADEWADEGAAAQSNSKSAAMTVVVRMTFNNDQFEASVNTLYSSIAGKAGKFKK